MAWPTGNNQPPLMENGRHVVRSIARPRTQALARFMVVRCHDGAPVPWR